MNGDGTARASVQIDNERVRVTEWRFRPGEATGWHVHAYDYVIVPLLDGSLRIVDEGGEQRVELRAGLSYYRQAGVRHDVINAGAGEMAFVEVEIKAHGLEG